MKNDLVQPSPRETYRRKHLVNKAKFTSLGQMPKTKKMTPLIQNEKIIEENQTVEIKSRQRSFSVPNLPSWDLIFMHVEEREVKIDHHISKLQERLKVSRRYLKLEAEKSKDERRISVMIDTDDKFNNANEEEDNALSDPDITKSGGQIPKLIDTISSSFMKVKNSNSSSSLGEFSSNDDNEKLKFIISDHSEERKETKIPNKRITLSDNTKKKR